MASDRGQPLKKAGSGVQLLEEIKSIAGAASESLQGLLGNENLAIEISISPMR